MKTILIAGGNSGIGRQAARDLLADGHRVVLMGRDQRKGEAALASFGNQADRASFVAANLSTHAGVRDAARRMLDQQDGIDALVHSTGVLTLQESRTADGLHPFFAVNYLSRYHLTQLLLPVLRQAERPVVVMMTAAIHPAPHGRLPDPHRRLTSEPQCCRRQLDLPGRRHFLSRGCDARKRFPGRAIGPAVLGLGEGRGRAPR
ncbi:SDR family NAD(P)-dependent oxidoreductase, partial [Streptomyces sp. NPDC058293]|uniref:SDR family NAD(P)-dependent oxidoreductase n=1 Tax=Streptomyces sp. NPDC058293 TaxID=3346429 RepID=UPI0036E7E3D2